MFFPKDVLIRKGKFGIIWIAATHNTGKCNFLTKRDYFNVNVPRTCHDILHPAIPFALRLSSQLMFGVSKIYQKQTRITLEEAQQMWVRVNDAFDKRKSLELFCTVARFDTITMGDPVRNATMNYLVDPFREDIIPYPEPLFLAGDASFLEVNGTVDTFLSPSKNSVKSSSSEIMASPMQADKKDITLPEHLILSPNQPIEVPGDIDFGPYLDEDPFEHLGLDAAPLPEKANDIARESQPQGPEDTADRHEEDAPSRSKADAMILEVLDDVVLIDADMDLVVGPITGDAPQERESQQERRNEYDRHRDEPLVLARERATMRPAKRRRLLIDREIKLSGDSIRANLTNPTDTLKQLIIGAPQRLSVRELFSTPACTYLASDRISEIWHENAKTFQDPTLHENFNILSEESAMESPDRILRAGITPTSIEIPRAADEISTEFERSGISSLTMDSTPAEHESSGQTRKRNLEGEEWTLDRRRSSHARVDILSPIADEFGEELAVPLEEIEEDPAFQDSGEDGLPSLKLDEFLRDMREVLGDRDEILFSDIALPGKTKRKAASRSFFHILSLNAREVIKANQEEVYGEIRINRGRKF
ncbi:meiotic recombination protein REC8 homolog [Rhopilema esculentum]|uniref:meiotic recombination protein REC8 homolog n=1 Tax=Rhopilema esculentum TaxID=499914 RepID=UPI0031DF2C33